MHLIIFALTICLSSNCLAAEKAKTPQVAKAAEKEPLTIDSDNGLECSKTDGTCTAKGNVVAQKGGLTLRSSQLAATLSKGQNAEKPTVNKVEATGGVRMTGAPGETAVGARAVYDMSSSSVKLYGSSGRNAVVRVGEYILHAKEVTVKMDSSKKIQSVDARDDVLLSSPENIVLADKAHYTPGNNMVLAEGNVKVDRKEGEITGHKAEVNIDTGQCVMLPKDSCEKKERVRVVLIPNNIDKSVFKDKASE